MVAEWPFDNMKLRKDVRCYGNLGFRHLKICVLKSFIGRNVWAVMVANNGSNGNL